MKIAKYVNFYLSSGKAVFFYVESNDFDCFFGPDCSLSARTYLLLFRRFLSFIYLFFTFFHFLLFAGGSFFGNILHKFCFTARELLGLYKVLTLFMTNHLAVAYRWERESQAKTPPPYNLSDIFYNYKTWHSYALPKEYLKIYK